MYEDFDNEVVSVIANGNKRFSDIWPKVRTSMPFPKAGGKERAVDSRLQALRKKGRIRYVTGSGWECIDSA